MLWLLFSALPPRFSFGERVVPGARIQRARRDKHRMPTSIRSVNLGDYYTMPYKPLHPNKIRSDLMASRFL